MDEFGNVWNHQTNNSLHIYIEIWIQKGHSDGRRIRLSRITIEWNYLESDIRKLRMLQLF